MIQKWITVNDQSDNQFCVIKNIRFKTPISISDLWGYIDVHILLKGTIDLLAPAANEDDKAEKYVVFENMNLVKHLDIVMTMYNLLGYSHSYSITLGCLWN